MAIKTGDAAPDFSLPNQYGETVSLSDFRGKKNVVLVFYPFAFSGLCSGELCEIRDDISEFQSDGVQTIAVSCDPVFSLKAWAEQSGYEFPLLSDFYPHGEVADAYGAFLKDKGHATRATFIIDKEGVVRWQVINGPGEVRSLDDYKKALSELS